jgi:hypothetical protein
MKLPVSSIRPITAQRFLAPVEGGGTTQPPVNTTLVCGYESGWNDLADGGFGAPINPNSFADYETVVQNCGTAQQFTTADVAGSAFNDQGEITTFNDTAAAGTVQDPGTGVYNDGAGFSINFEWYVETATCTGCTHNYLVLYSDTTIDPSLPLAMIRETSALTGINGSNYTFVRYSEQSNYSDTDRATGSDGEIWSSTDILQ